jgi:hypothetical protein
VSLPSEFAGQGASRRGGPPQPGHRIAPGVRLHPRIQGLQQLRVGPGQRPTAATATTRTPRSRVLAHLQLVHPRGHRHPRYPSSPGHQRNSAMPQRPRLSRQQQATPALVRMRQDRPELRRRHPLIDLPDHGHTRSTTKPSPYVKVNLRQSLRDRRVRSSHSPITGCLHGPHMNGWHSLRSCLSRRSAIMNDYDPTSPHETLPAHPVSSATSGPPVAGSSAGVGAAPPPPPACSPDWSASVTMAKQARRPRVRRLLSNRRSGWIVAAALMCAVIGLPPVAPRPPRQQQGTPGPAAGDPTLGLDRPQGEHPARSTACLRRASPCRHQRVRR